jgi:hypothetical protein
MAEHPLNNYEFLQWLISTTIEENLKSLLLKVDQASNNFVKLNERIEKMDANLQAKFDKMTSDFAVASELNSKILNEVKDNVKKLADAQSGSADAIKAAVDAAKAAQAAEDKAAFDAAMAEISAAADGLQSAQAKSLESAKLIDDQIADLVVPPVVEPTPTPAV